MPTVAAVGKSTSRRSRQAGIDAAQVAMDGIEGRTPNLVLAFGTVGYDQEDLLAGIRSVVGEVSLSGCSAEGVITQDGSDEGSHAIAVLALASNNLDARVFSIEGLSHDPSACGARLAEQVNGSDLAKPSLLLLFPDGLTGNCTELLEALEARLDQPLIIAGGTAGDMMKMERSFQYADGRVLSDAVTAVLLGGDFEVELAVSHGCDPIGTDQTITRAEGGAVYEIDGRPAWDVFREYVEGNPEDLVTADLTHLCLGERLEPEPSRDYDEYILRSALGLDKEAGALFFPGGLRTGATVRMSMRNADRVARSAEESARRVRERRPGQRPALVLQFDCAGRGHQLFGAQTTEKAIAPSQRVLGTELPWLGFHTFGEIAPLAQKTYFHNVSVVLCAIYDPPE